MVEVLGKGAMGEVFRAIDPEIGRFLAIKRLRIPQGTSEAETEEMRLRFAREAAAAGRLSDHPGIVTIYHSGQESDFQYIAMELVSGGSLETQMLPGKPWPFEKAMNVVRQVANALDYAHANGIVHRDIKPGNILMQADGRVQVADFGIARVTSQTMTRTGLAMGTPAYMAPEQIEGEKVDAGADQFSLAVVAFRLLTGRLPFEGASELAILLKIRSDEPLSLTAANPGIPATVESVIRRALAKEPERRFESCSQFATALGASFRDSEETRRSGPGPSPIGRPWLTPSLPLAPHPVPTRQGSWRPLVGTL